MLQENWHYAQPQRTHVNLPMRDCSFNFFEIFHSKKEKKIKKKKVYTDDEYCPPQRLTDAGCCPTPSQYERLI